MHAMYYFSSPRLKLCNSTLHDFDSFLPKMAKGLTRPGGRNHENIFEMISVKHDLSLSHLCSPISLSFLFSIFSLSFSSLPLFDLCLNSLSLVFLSLSWKWVSALVLKNQRLNLKSSGPRRR